jgi:hypothetical protein
MRTVTYEKNRLPEDILRAGKKDELLEAAHHPRDRA